MIAPQFNKDESNQSILREKLLNWNNQKTPPDSISKISIAYGIARICHLDQTRDEGTPYIVHPLRISLYLAETIQLSDGFFKNHSITREDAVIIALLHDTLEDFGEKVIPVIEEEFGANVLRMIQFLTKDKKKSNAENFDYLRTAPEIVKVIKVLDRLDNLRGLLNSVVKSKKKKIEYLSESKSKIITLLDPDCSPEHRELAAVLRSVISFLEKSLSK